MTWFDRNRKKQRKETPKSELNQALEHNSNNRHMINSDKAGVLNEYLSGKYPAKPLPKK